MGRKVLDKNLKKYKNNYSVIHILQMCFLHFEVALDFDFPIIVTFNLRVNKMVTNVVFLLFHSRIFTETLQRPTIN